jgi:biotin carboxylase
MANILLLCAGDRDLRELALCGATSAHRIVRHDYGTDALERLVSAAPHDAIRVRDPLLEIDDIASRYGGAVDGVISTDDYPGSTLAAFVASRFGLPGVAPLADLTCQHKFLARAAQRAAAPQAVPWFARIGNGAPAAAQAGIRFPAFVKPIKSFFSIGARRVDSMRALRDAIAVNPVSARFLQPLDRLLRSHAGIEAGPPLLVEGLLTGMQATLDGFVADGQVVALGVVDSIMFPGTISFDRFEYPSSLPVPVQRRMADVARDVLTSIGFDNGLFNIEFMHDPVMDTISIVEINPRMSSQFADLYEKVDGFNPYAVLVDLALGREPVVSRRRGRHAMAASCVLRTFDDCDVIAVPAPAQVDALLREHPDARVEILATPGTRLSHTMQDGASYRYGLLNLGGESRADILAKFDACRRAMPFALISLGRASEGPHPQATAPTQCWSPRSHCPLSPRGTVPCRPA